jgi:hypothetical protein
VHHERDHGHEPERQPVQVHRVRHPDQAGRQPGPVDGQALVAAGEVAGVAGHRDRADLGERERHHRERYSLGTQRDRAQRQGEHGGPGHRHERDSPQWPVRAVEQDRGAVRPGREVQRRTGCNPAAPP